MNVLFTSEETLKSIYPISLNLEGHYLLSAIKNAQEMYVKPVVGKCLYTKLQELIDAEEEIDEIYTDILDKIGPFLAYQTLAELSVTLSFKINNIGLHSNDDEHNNSAGWSDIMHMSKFFKERANFFARELIKYLKDNYNDIPELKECVSCADLTRRMTIPNIIINLD